MRGGTAPSIARFALTSESSFANDLTLTTAILHFVRSYAHNSFTTRFNSANASSFLSPSASASILIFTVFSRSDSFFDFSSFVVATLAILVERGVVALMTSKMIRVGRESKEKRV
ncbi:hypothetical protein VNO80_01644 [Phaseolus coccineus]|uniref:Uncharacterized protein n=1 Tax=Phaseolus coccineus TaxID=3886 RepID=A0AAN9RT34_PHACN